MSVKHKQLISPADRLSTDLGSVLLVVPVPVVYPLPQELHGGHGAAVVHLHQVKVTEGH